MAYDSARRRTVVFGGDVGGSGSDTVREWDGTTWSTPVTTTRPPARETTAMAYDLARGRIIFRHK